MDKTKYVSISFEPIFAGAKQWAQKTEAVYRSQLYPPEVHDSYDSEKFDDINSSGDKLLASMECDICNCRPPPVSKQWRMIKTFWNVSGPWYFGDEWILHKAEIMERHNWIEYDGILAVQMERKSGKSTGLAYSVLADVLNVADAKIALISGTREQAQIILFLIIDFFRRHPRKGDFKAKFNKREFGLETSRDRRIVTAYSGDPNVSTTGGEGRGIRRRESPPPCSGTYCCPKL